MTTYEWMDPKGNRWIASADAKARDSEIARNLETLRLAAELDSVKRFSADRLDARDRFVTELERRVKFLESEALINAQEHDRAVAENRDLKTFVNEQAEEIDRLTKGGAR